MPVADDKGACFRQKPSVEGVIVFRYNYLIRRVWLQSTDLVSFCVAVKSHFAYSSQSRYNSEFQGLLPSYLAVCTTALRLRKIFTGWFACSGRGKFSPVATISRSALQVREKSAPNFLTNCANLRIVWYICEENYNFFPTTMLN